MNLGRTSAVRTEPTSLDKHPQKRILVVDDEPSILNSLSNVLSHAYGDYLIGTAASAEEALELLRNAEVDLLITDLKLPQMDGLSLAKNTHDFSPSTRSILMTAFGTTAIHSDAYRTGCVAYLEKPFDIDTLLKSIDQTLAVEEEPDPVAASLTVGEILQSYAMRGDGTVSLQVSHKNSGGVLFMEDGIVQFAEFDGLHGPAALVAILGCKSPSITLLTHSPRFQRRGLSIPWQAVIAASRCRSIAEQFRVLKLTADLVPPEMLSPLHDIYRMHETERPRNPLWTPLDSPDPVVPIDSNRLVEIPGLDAIDSPLDATLKQQRIRNLVHAGVDHFRLDELEKARRCWLAALRIDPECRIAKRNIAVVRKMLMRRTLL